MMKSLARTLPALFAVSALAPGLEAKIIGAIMAAPTGVIQQSASRPAPAPTPARQVRIQPVYFQAPAYTPYATSVVYAPAYGYGAYGASAVPAGTVSIGGGARLFSGVSFLPATAAPAAPRPVGPRTNAEVTATRLATPRLALPAGGPGVRPDPMLSRTRAMTRDMQQRYGLR